MKKSTKGENMKPETRLAILAFERAERKHHQLEKVEEELSKMNEELGKVLALVPKEDLNEYYIETEKLRTTIALGCPVCGTATQEAIHHTIKSDNDRG